LTADVIHGREIKDFPMLYDSSNMPVTMLREVTENKCYYLDLFDEFGTKRRDSMTMTRERLSPESQSNYGGGSRTQSLLGDGSIQGSVNNE